MSHRPPVPGALAPDFGRPAHPRQQLSLFSNRLIISAGTMELGAPVSGSGPLKKGLKVVVILSGKERIKIEGHPMLDMSGPQSCVILNQHDSNKMHWVASDVPLRFALVQLDPAFAYDEFGLELTDLLKAAGGSQKPLLHVHAATAVLQSLASQIVACPMSGAMRQMYLASKGLELVSTAVNPIMTTADERGTHLSASDLRRVHQAYDRLIETIEAPPSLAELGRAVGLNATKLTTGFRRVFGTTVFGMLQEHRLGQAYRMLASGQMTVSEAAYRVGYSPAHFATIFRRRFGVSPSKLR